MALDLIEPAAPAQTYARINAAIQQVNALVAQLAALNTSVGDRALQADLVEIRDDLGEKASNAQITVLSDQIYAQLGTIAEALTAKASNAQLTEAANQIYEQIGRIAALMPTKADNAQINALSAQIYATIDRDRDTLDGLMAALSASTALVSASVLPREAGRPGAAPGLFVTSLSDTDLLALPAVSSGDVVDEDDGAAVRITGRGLVADRALRALERGRRYRVRIAVRRRVDSPDPSNDAVRIALAWYGRGGPRLAGAGAQTVIVDLTDLTVARGRVVVEAIVSRSAAGTVTHVAPYGARSVRPFVQTYGTDCQTDVEVVEWTDASALEGISPDLTALRSDLDGMVSQNLGARLGVVESTVGTPLVKRFGVRGDAVAATIPIAVDVIETLGFYARGDGGGVQYRRTAAGSTAAGKFKSADGSWWEPAVTVPTPLQYGARGNGTTNDTAAIAIGREIDLPAGDYRYLADTLDPKSIGRVSRKTRLRSVRAGDNLLRDRRTGELFGYAQNHREEACYGGAYPRVVPATPIKSGNFDPPPMSTAAPAGPVDIIAHYYGDWGLDWYRRATGIAGPSFDGWYDGAWNKTSSPTFDPARHSILGHYRNDDPNVLDWQCYWLREAGVKAVIPCAFDFDPGTWGDATNRHLWIYRLFNCPNFKGLSYIPWARTTNFDNPDGPVTATAAQITAQWQSLWFVLALAYPNNYVLDFGGKRWFCVYCWNTALLGKVFDPGNGAVNFAAWLKTRADEVKSLGYDGLCVLSHNAIADADMSRDALLDNGVLYLDSLYGGPRHSDAASLDYAGLVRTYSPPTKGALINVSTALQSKTPIDVFHYPGSSPELFREHVADGIRHVLANPALPRAMTIYNVSEWAEGGASLHPTVGNGFGYLDAIRWASSVVAQRGGTLVYRLPLFANWQALGGTNEPPVYWKDGNGLVHISGLMRGGYVAADGATVLAALPVGYRPVADTVRQVLLSGGGSSGITIDRNGNVRAYAPLNAVQTSLSIAPFRAA